MATENKPQKGFRLKITLFLLGVLLFLVSLNFLSQAINTLRELDSVEADRDQWQRPSDVLQALDLKHGDVVVDLGSGAGYFTLKLSGAVGDQGKVIAVDLRRLSLSFLWTRTLLRHQHNVSITVGEPNNPRLGTSVADAVLVANTYHELADSSSILTHIFRALRPGGRLVIVDRGPVPAIDPHGEEATDAHEIPVARVEGELNHGGFTIVRTDRGFIERPGDNWWLIVAQKPR
jgi:predicted methyltransferase